MDIVSFLTMLASAAGVAVVAKLSASALEHLAAFQNLSSNGKLVAAISVAALVGLIAKALTQALAANPNVVSLIAPYWDVIYIAGSIAVQQISHGSNKGPAKTDDGAKG